MLPIAFRRPSAGRTGISLFALLPVALAANVAIAGGGQAPRAAAATGNVKQLWESAIAEEANEVEYKASAVSRKDESIWLVLGRRPALMMSGPQRLALDTLDRTGKIVSENSLESLAKAAGLTRVPDQFLDLAATPDGDLAVVLSSAAQVSVVMVDGKSHRVIQGKNIGAPRPDLLITRAIPAGDGNLRLLGRAGARAIAITLDRKLAVLSEKLANPGEASIFLDGSPLSDGTFVLAGARPAKPGTSTGPSVWLGYLSAEGQLTKPISMPGRFASVAAAPEGGCAMVQGILSAQGAEFWFRSYDHNLKEWWSVKLVSGTRDLQPFRIASAGQGTAEYLILGAENHRLQLSRVRAGSALLWTQVLGAAPGPMPPLVWNYGLAPAASSVVVASTEMVVNVKMQQRQVVKVMNLDIR